MAGPYLEAPASRMAYDADGSYVAIHKGTADWIADTPGIPGEGDAPIGWTEASTTIKTYLNDESIDTYVGDYANWPWVAVIVFFPQSRELDGVYYQLHPDNYQPPQSYSSANTHDGHGGDWTSLGVDGRTTIVQDDYRNNITSLAVNAQKAVRFAHHCSYPDRSYVYSFHIYGTISAGETPTRLIFLDTESSDAQFTRVLDFGDVPREQTSVRTFKLKNNSSTSEIIGITVTAEDLYLNAGDWYAFSLSGATSSYVTSLNIGNLGPGGSKLIHMRQIIPGAETLGAQAGRIKADHTAVA